VKESKSPLLLFYGPPGTGKTHTIRYLSRIPEHTTLLITAEQVTLIAEYMALARLLSQTIVVIGDVDLIARDRAELSTPGQESLLNRLLNEMDGLGENSEVLFILTTNRPEALEAALAGRPGAHRPSDRIPTARRSGPRAPARALSFWVDVAENPLETLVRRTEGTSAAPSRN